MGSLSYQYDGLGNRIQQTVGANFTKYLLDLQPGLAVILRAQAWDETDPGDPLLTDTVNFVHSPRGIHAQETMSGWEWMVQDGLGSVRGGVDNSIGVLESRNYDPYGESFGATGTNQTSYGFTGEHTDPITGLVHLRARYYNPAAGVFTALDPFEGMASRPMSLNGYSWVEGNTPNMVDPSGMCTDPLTCAALIGIGVLGIFGLIGCTSEPSVPVLTSLSNSQQRQSMLKSSVGIQIGQYGSGCPRRTEVGCGPIACGPHGVAVHVGLGTIVEGGYIVSHDHYGQSPSTPQMAVDALRSGAFYFVPDYVEFRGGNGTFHIPIDKLEAANVGLQTAAFKLPSQCNVSNLGEPARIAPLRAWGINNASDFASKCNGSPIFHAFIEGPNPGAGEPGSGLMFYWYHLDIALGAIVGATSGGRLVTRRFETDERLASGDSGGGNFVVVDERVYFVGPSQGVAPTSDGTSELLFTYLVV